MISIFGAVSMGIIVLSVGAMLLHMKIMRKRVPVDNNLSQLEDLYRERVEILLLVGDYDTELYYLCLQYVDLDFASMQRAMPDIDAAFEDILETGCQIEEDTTARLVENAQAIQKVTDALNKAITEYNEFITTRPIEGLMARILGLTIEGMFD